MKKRLFVVALAICFALRIQASSVTYLSFATPISQYNGLGCENLFIELLSQSDALLVCQEMACYFGSELARSLTFSSSSVFTNPAGNKVCNNVNNVITARAIDLFLILAIQARAYEIAKFWLTFCSSENATSCFETNSTACSSTNPDVNMCNLIGGSSPLIFAVENNHLAMAKLLIEHGADVTACTNTGLTPLDIAVSLLNQNMVNLLLYSK